MIDKSLDGELIGENIRKCEQFAHVDRVWPLVYIERLFRRRTTCCIQNNSILQALQPDNLAGYRKCIHPQENRQSKGANSDT